MYLIENTERLGLSHETKSGLTLLFVGNKSKRYKFFICIDQN